MTTPTRTAALLTSRDLDTLLAQRVALAPLLDDEVDDLVAVLRSWSDEDAVGNVLLHADLLPLDLVWPAVLRGLAADGWPRLGATVGARLVGAGLPAGPHREALVAALLGAVSAADDTASASAAVALAELAGPADLDPLVALASRRAGTVRHNLLAAALTAGGSRGVAMALEDLVAAGAVDAVAAAALTAEAGHDAARVALLPALDRGRAGPSQQLLATPTGTAS